MGESTTEKVGFEKLTFSFTYLKSGYHAGCYGFGPHTMSSPTLYVQLCM